MTTKNKILIGSATAVVVIIIAGLLYFFLGTSKLSPVLSVEATKGDITEKINLTGQVKASQGVDLAFEGSGKIVANYVTVGQKIYTGEALVSIDSSLLQSQLQQAQAQLQQAQAQVDALNIDTVKSKTDAGLQTAYQTSLSSAQKSVSTAKDLLMTITDIQYNHFTDLTNQNIDLQKIKAKAILSLLGQSDAGVWTSQSLANLQGGAYGLVQTAINNPTQDNIDLALSSTKIALQDVNNFISALPITTSLNSTERATISSAKTGINVEIITTTANIQTISSLKVNNSATISTTNDQIEGAKASTAVVQATINSINTQISKTTIRALFNGQVDKDNVTVGAMESAGTPMITISNNNLEIDTNIPEIDISKTKAGNSANVTLDAYGDSVVFPATIVSIDTAPTMVNGVSVYGAKLKFNNFDTRIKPGMTANIKITSDTHKNILMVPKSAVIQKDGAYFVVVDIGGGEKITKPVTVGLNDDKNIEILTGLSLNEKVLSY